MTAGVTMMTMTGGAMMMTMIGNGTGIKAAINITGTTAMERTEERSSIAVIGSRRYLAEARLASGP